MEQVKAACIKDPKLLILFQSYPQLKSILESIPNLSYDNILSILTAVANEVMYN